MVFNSAKNNWFFYSLLLCSFFQVFFTFAQDNRRCRWLKTQARIALTDTLSIVPQSVSIVQTFPATNFQISFVLKDNTLILKDSLLWQRTDSLLVCYRVFPFDLEQKSSLRIEKIDSMKVSLPRFTSQETFLPTKEELFATPQLQKTGSLTRGISFGNVQDVFVNSTLNLQLEGKLSDDLELTATITDQNIPYQPEGNTQQIQDFDRVFIQLKHKSATLSAGDILLKNDSSYFLKFWKNVQGVQATVHWHPTKHKMRQSKLGASIAKGQFHSLWLEPLEGVSGPYRLTGPNGERFLVVIANSEKVFLDGKQLERGFLNDYVINYNTAEITFTSRILVTKFSRIRIDFEYALQVYARSIVQASHQETHDKWRLLTNFYREADQKENPLFMTLSEEEKNLLATAGDRQELAFSTSIDTLSAFTTERIVYTKKDTLVGGIVYSIFTVAQPSDKTFYLLNFTEVGANKGDYVVAAYTAQGRTYRWVAPQNGVPQGNFAPIKRLIPPNSRQMASLSGTYQITKKSHFFTEIAFSDHDKNLFSSQDDNDNRGIALKTGIQTVEQPFSHYLTLSYGVDGEYNSLHFKPIDRFREVEFDRNWSINPDTLQAAKEHIVHGFFYLQTTSSLPFKGKLRYDSWKRYRPTQLSGVQHALSYRWEWRKWEFSLDNFWLKALLTQQSAQWQKTELLLKRREKWFSTGYRYSTDLHQVRQLPSQEVVRTAMHAKIHRLFLESSDSLTARYRWRWYADVVLREDAAPQKGELAKSNFTQELNLKLQQQTTKRQFQTWFTYRLLENLFPNLSPYEETVMFRCDWSESFWNQLIRQDFVYNIGSGRELKREFIFVRVDNGIGTHTWRDDNGNGIQELGEFYPAINLDERNYAKYFVPTDTYLPAFVNQLNYRWQWQFPNTVKWLKRLSGNLALVSDKKIQQASLLERFLPLALQGDSEKVFAQRNQLRNTLFFNRQQTRWGGEWQYAQSAHKQLLSNGFEWRRQQENQWLLRYNFTKTINLRLQLVRKRIDNRADFLNDRNYSIAVRELSPEITYQPSQRWRIAIKTTHKNKTGMLQEEKPSSEKTIFHEWRIETKWAELLERTVTIEFKYTKVNFSGRINSPLGYEMVEALNNGHNFTWNIQLTQKILNGLQFNASYNGRKADEQRITHIGRMQLTALF